MKSIHLLGSFAFILFVFSPFVCFGAGYEFEGVGAREVSRGGAVIADSLDWTSVYWNPANIVTATKKSGTEVGLELIAGEAFERDSNSLSSLPLGGTTFSKNELHLNSFLGALGVLFPVGGKFGFGFGFYTPLLQGSNFKDTSASPVPVTLDLKNSVGLLTWTISGSYEWSPQLALGAGVNVLYGKLKSDITIDNYPIPTNQLTNKTKGDGLALEGIFGARYDLDPKLSVGCVFRTGSDLEVDGEAKVENSHVLLPDEKSDFSYDLRHPPTWGIGMAFRPTPKLVWTVDFNRTLWHRFVNNVVYKSPGALLVNVPNSFHWKDTWKVRTGIQYALSDKTDLLGGYSYDNPAMDAGSVDFATALDVRMHRFSAGVAHRWASEFETIIGMVGGSGDRKEGPVSYRLSGYQVMLEGRYKF